MLLTKPADAEALGRQIASEIARGFASVPVVTSTGPGGVGAGGAGSPDFQKLAANIATYAGNVRSLTTDFAALTQQVQAFTRATNTMSPGNLAHVIQSAQQRVAGMGLPAAGGPAGGGTSPQQLQQVAVAHQQVGTAATNAGQQATAAMNQANTAVVRYHSSLRSMLSTFLRVTASAYVLERMGRGAVHMAAAPYEAITDATTDSRKFELAIGGGPQAHEINQGLMSRINQYPFAMSDARQATIDMTRAGIAPSQASQYLGTLTNLQAVNPQATPEAVTRAVDQAMLGQARGLRNIVRIDPDQLAQLGGRDRATDFRGRPELLMQALSTYGRIFAPPGASDALNQLPGVQMGHIRDQFASAFSQVGDSGVFNVIVDKMRATADELAQYFDPNNAQWVKHAKSISDSLATIFTNVTDALAGGLARLAGTTSVEKTPEGITSGIDKALQHIAVWSQTLPKAAEDAGMALNRLVAVLQHVANAVDIVSNEMMKAQLYTHVGAEMLWSAMGFGSSTAPNAVRATSPTTQPTGTTTTGTSATATDGRDPYRDIREPLIAAMTGQTALLSGYSVDKEDKFDLLRKDSSAAMQKILTSGVLSPESRRGFQGVLDHTSDATAFELADQALAQRDLINRAIARGGFGMAEAAKSDPFLASILYKHAFSGTTRNANDAALAEHFAGNKSGTFGFGALSVSEQLEMLRSGTDAQLKSIKESGVGLPASDSLIASLAGRQSTSGQQATVYSQMLGYAEQTQANARRARDANPNDPQAQAAFQAATEQVQQYEAELNKARIATNAFFEGIVQYGNQAQHTLESGLSGALTNVETHAKNVSQSLREMARSLLNEFNSMMVHSLFGSILGNGNGQPGVGNGIGGLIGAGISGMFSQTAGATGAAAAGIPSDAVLVAGAGFASGGVASRASIFGEGPGPEAAIPLRGGAVPIGIGPTGPVALLPGGRSVPAQLYGDGGVAGAYSGMPYGPQAGSGHTLIQPKVFVVQSADEIFREGFNANKDLVIHTTGKHLGPGGSLRRSLARSH